MKSSSWIEVELEKPKRVAQNRVGFLVRKKSCISLHAKPHTHSQYVEVSPKTPNRIEYRGEMCTHPSVIREIEWGRIGGGNGKEEKYRREGSPYLLRLFGGEQF